MADFCNRCTERMFGSEIKPDIDVIEIGKSLEPGFYQSVLCEGCGLRVVSKSEAGNIQVAGTAEENEDTFMKFMSYEEYIEKYSSI